MLLVRKYLCGLWDTVRGRRVFSRLVGRSGYRISLDKSRGRRR